MANLEKEKEKLEAGWEKLEEERKVFEEERKVFAEIRKELEKKAEAEQRVINPNPKNRTFVAPEDVKAKVKTTKVKVKTKFAISPTENALPGDIVVMTEERATALKGTLVE